MADQYEVVYDLGHLERMEDSLMVKLPPPSRLPETVVKSLSII